MVSGLPVSLPPASCMLWFQAPQGLGCTGQEVGVQALHSHQLPVGPRSPPVRASVSPSVWWGQRGLAASDQAHRTGKQAPPPNDCAPSSLAAHRPQVLERHPQHRPQVWTLESHRPNAGPGPGSPSIRRACLEEETPAARPPGPWHEWNPEPKWA